MEPIARLKILAEAARYDASCASSGAFRARSEGGLGNSEGMGICHSYTPDGRCVSLLKVLLTNVCIYDCRYCVNRVSSGIPRARFTPGELADLTMDFYRRNYIEGLFLSSGIVRSVDETMEEMVRVARLLRETHGFGGYIHLKVIPGASAHLVEQAGLLADRLSANLELPTQADLDRLAPAKTLVETEGSMAEITARHEAVEPGSPSFAPAGQSTQLIVGATPADDATLLRTADRLYRRHRLRRVYYTAFSPIPDADPGLPPAAPPLVREHRLYEADWLVRHYGFDVGEIAETGNLSLDMDPKLAWALRHREWFPVDVRTASREQLLRVPGFGVRSVGRLLALRRHHAVRLDDLARLRVPLHRCRPFVVTADHVPADLDSVSLAERVRPVAQLGLFEAAQSLTNNPSRRPLDAFGAPHASASITGGKPALSAEAQGPSEIASAGSVRDDWSGSRSARTGEV